MDMDYGKIVENLAVFVIAAGIYYFKEKKTKKETREEIDKKVKALEDVNRQLMAAISQKQDKEVFDRRVLLTSLNVIQSVKHICTDIKKRAGAHRVDYWYLHNGVITSQRLHIIKASMLVEDTNGSTTITSSQNIPVAHFYRNIAALADETGRDYIHTFESEIKDELSSLIMAFGVSTFYAFKTYDESGYFEGMVTVGFQEKKYTMPQNVLSLVKLRVASVTPTIQDQIKISHEQNKLRESNEQY